MFSNATYRLIHFYKNVKGGPPIGGLYVTPKFGVPDWTLVQWMYHMVTF